ncbi:MAG: FIST signal transduction protein [Selenomonadaceae bacterium]
MIKVAVGHSEEVDSLDAVEAVLKMCQEDLGGLLPQAGILYTAIEYEHPVILNRIMDCYPQLELIGCTTDGEISSKIGFDEDSITLMLFYADCVEIKAGCGRKLLAGTQTTVKTAVDSAKSELKKKPAFCLSLAESITVGGVAILEALKRELGTDFPIFGALAADQWSMKKTYQFYKREVLTDSVEVLLFAGPILFSSGIANGWTPIGHKKRITKVDHNRVFEADGEPIVDFYNRYVGGNYSRVPTEYPLAIFPDKASNRFYIRGPYTFDQEDKSITFFGDVPSNVTVQLASGSQDKMSQASRHALKEAIDAYPGKQPAAAMVFTCSLRKSILGVHVAKEYEYLQQTMPEGFPFNGICAYGEIAPLENGKESYFHNGTIAVVLVGEE